MQLIHIKPAAAATRKKKGRKANLQDSFDKYWRLVEKCRQENAALAENLAQLRRRYEADVVPVEQELNEAMAAECFHLMTFLNGKGLSASIRMSLIDWLSGNVEALQSHPYYPAAEKEKVVNAVVDCLQQQSAAEGKGRGRRRAAADHPNQGLFGEDWLDPPNSGQEQAEGDRTFGDMDESLKEFFSEDEWEEFKRMFDDDGAEHARGDDQFNKRPPPQDDKIVRPESINLLFRRLAQVLHPDKELDPARKAEKHELMSQLLKAREHHDLPALLALHREYIAAEPLVVEEDELRGLIAMLKNQLAQLTADQQRLISQDPVTFAIYHWYHGNAPKRINSNIKQHVQQLRFSIDECRLFVEEVKTARELRSFLRMRGLE
jgi:hypothetical protein